MKKNFILFSAALGIGYLALSSYTLRPYFNGYGNCTGSPGSTASCSGSGCHSSSTATLNTGITLVDKATSLPVTSGQYIPGKTYIATLSGTNSSSLAKFGFQVCVVNAGGTADVGSMTATDANSILDTHTGSAIHILEHKTGPVTAATAGVYTVSFDWTAPTSGSGTVNFYSVINAVNGNGSESGDAVGPKVTTSFTENTTSVAELSAQIQSKVYPNPANYLLNIGLENATTGNYHMQVSDMNGKTVLNQNEIVNSTSFVSAINIASLEQGNYFLRIENNNATRVIPFIKK